MKPSLARFFSGNLWSLKLLFISFWLKFFAFNPLIILPEAIPSNFVILKNKTLSYSSSNSYLMSEELFMTPQSFLQPFFFNYPYRNSKTILTSISSVRFENLDNTPMDKNPGNGKPDSNIGGYRLFPDKLSPDDTKQRNKIRVIATLSSLQPGIKIYFAAFDMDDPSANGLPLDNENKPEDNKGVVKEKNSKGEVKLRKAGKLSSSWAFTQKNGVAFVDFTVTKQPGDNFSVVASTHPIDENNKIKLGNKYIKIYSDKSDKLVLENTGNEIPVSYDPQIASNQVKPTSNNAEFMRTETLTIWRRLHLEIDDMGKITNPPLTGKLKKDVVINPGPNSLFCNDLGISNLQPLRYESGNITFSKTDSIEIIRNEDCRFDLNSKMKSPKNFPIGTSFEIYDDDDFNENNSLPNGDNNEDVEIDEDIFKHFKDEDGNYDDEKKTPKNIFAQAYIKPDRNWAETSGFNQHNIKFELNLEYSKDKRIGKKSFQELLNEHRDSMGLENNDFWIAYLLIGYQGPRTQDCDGYTEGEMFPCIGGVGMDEDGTTTKDNVLQSEDVPKGVYGSAIFIEAIKDDLRTKRNEKTTGIPPDPDIMWHTGIPHEIGHQFGINGDDPSIPSQKIMSHSAFQIYYEFSDSHLNIIRFRIPSPGSLSKSNFN